MFERSIGSIDAVKCKLCQNIAQVKKRAHPGYKQFTYYDIVHCDACNTSFALPMKEDKCIYDLIYDQARKLPGYSRYVSYAEGVEKAIDPLGFLSKREDVYWAIEQWLISTNLMPTDKIMEVGSGLGYLTYAIARRGYDICGFDISERTVSSALHRFGERFFCADLEKYSKQHGPIYKAIIATEIIEHVADVHNFFDTMMSLLLPGGSLLVTTPNKTIYPSCAVWETDLPPVHLWWFSERSMKVLAQDREYILEFTDFSKYNERSFVPVLAPSNKTARLDQFGRAMKNNRAQIIKEIAIRSGTLWVLRRFSWLLQQKDENRKKRSKTICAIFRKKDE